MIEPGLCSPAIGQVTTFTVGAKLTQVRVVILMAGATILRQRVSKLASVARVASQIFMTLRQRCTGFGTMVERFWTPAINRVTTCAV